MHLRVRLQIDEAMGALNRWYCSQAHGRRVDEEELLICYFVHSGGAKNFAARYEEALSPLNRWYCSEFHGREISEPQMLWEYYCCRATRGTESQSSKNKTSAA